MLKLPLVYKMPQIGLHSRLQQWQGLFEDAKDARQIGPRKRTLSLGGYRLPKGVSTFYRNGWRLIFRDRSRRAYGLPGERWIDLGTHSDLIAARKAVELVQRFELGTYDRKRLDVHHGGRVYVRGYEAAGSKVGRPFKTKTGKERRVPLAAEAAAVLRRRRASRLTEDPRETVFVGPGGGPLAPGVVSRRFRHYRRLAKLPEEIHFHSLRHTCASWLATRGVSLRIIQEVLGHADVKSTQIYAHLASEVDGQITEALDATLDAARASEREVRGKAAQTVSRADLIAALQELIGAS